MKLWILLNEKVDPSLVGKEDILLTNQKSDLPLYSCKEKIVLLFNAVDEEEGLAASIRDFFASVKPEYRVLMNNLYADIFRPFAASARRGEELAKKFGVDRIVLVGGSNKPFLSLRHAGGEGNPVWFRLSWLACPLLKDFFEEKGYQVERIKRKNTFFLDLFCRFREMIFSGKILFNELRRSRRAASWAPPTLSLDPKKKTAVLLTQKPLQYRHLSNLFDGESSVNLIHLTTASEAKGENVLCPRARSFGAVWKSYFRPARCVTEEGSCAFSWEGIRFSLSRSALRRLFRSDLLAVERTTESAFETLAAVGIEPDFIVTNMSFGAELLEIQRRLEGKDTLHLNCQYVAMGKMLYPEVKLAHRFYLYTKKVYDFYAARSDLYRYYLPLQRIERRKVSDCPQVVLFPQPDSYAKRYLSFMEEFCDYVEKNKISLRLTVKPHYRQNELDAFVALAQRYDFVQMADKMDSVGDLMKKSDFAMSMTSSVLFEAVTFACPAFIIDIDGLDSDFITNSGITFETVNFRCRSVKEIADWILAGEKCAESFRERRERYLRESSALLNMSEIFLNEENLK